MSNYELSICFARAAVNVLNVAELCGHQLADDWVMSIITPLHVMHRMNLFVLCARIVVASL